MVSGQLASRERERPEESRPIAPPYWPEASARVSAASERSDASRPEVTFTEGTPVTAKLTPPLEAHASTDIEVERRRQTWVEKFRTALRGIKFGIRGHSSFFGHFFVAAAVICSAAVLRVSVVAWAILLLCIGAVFTAELFNSAIETLFRHLDTKTQARTWPALDIAAGAVLWISITAAVVGTLVFGQRLWEIFGG